MSEESPTLLEMLKRSDGLLFLPANAGDLAGVLRRSRDGLGLEPPDDYMAFLRLTDGAVADGLLLYGSKEHRFDDFEMPELVEINLQRRDYRDDLADVLLVGEAGDDFLAFRRSDRRYWRIERVSGDLLDDAPDLNALVRIALRYSEAA